MEVQGTIISLMSSITSFEDCGLRIAGCGFNSIDNPQSNKVYRKQNHVRLRVAALVLLRLKPPLVSFNLDRLIHIIAAAGVEDGGGDDLAGGVSLELEHERRR